MTLAALRGMSDAIFIARKSEAASRSARGKSTERVAEAARHPPDANIKVSRDKLCPR
jgi:hypothetical protein